MHSEIKANYKVLKFYDFTCTAAPQRLLYLGGRGASLGEQDWWAIGAGGSGVAPNAKRRDSKESEGGIPHHNTRPPSISPQRKLMQSWY